MIHYSKFILDDINFLCVSDTHTTSGNWIRFHHGMGFSLSGLYECYINWNIENCNFACGSVWMSNLVPDIKGGT
jgi:hypothetical protein